jgi:hypothetical protein
MQRRPEPLREHLRHGGLRDGEQRFRGFVVGIRRSGRVDLRIRLELRLGR